MEEKKRDRDEHNDWEKACGILTHGMDELNKFGIIDDLITISGVLAYN